MKVLLVNTDYYFIAQLFIFCVCTVKKKLWYYYEMSYDSPPPQILYVEALTPSPHTVWLNVTVFRDQTFQKVMRLKWGC